MQEKLIPSEAVTSLTGLFINLCAINALKMHLVAMDEAQKDGVISALLKQWETECQSIFDQRFLQINESLKLVPVQERLQAAMQVDKLKTHFDFDLLTAKANIAGLF